MGQPYTLVAIDKYPLSPKTKDFLQTTRFGNFIDGRMIMPKSGNVLPVYEPGSGDAFAEIVVSDLDDVDMAVKAARRSFEEGRWRFLKPSEREKRLRRLSALIEAHREVFLDLDTLEGGVLKGYSQFMVQYAIDIVDYYSGWPTKMFGTTVPMGPDLVVQEVKEPIGVVGVILPWNGPSAVPLGVVPALACGNSVVLKPSEETPLTAQLLARLCIEADIPLGVFNVVNGKGDVGAALVKHPQVDAISFTGSVETGRKIQQASAETLKRVGLELGGKSPHIIFKDADIDAAAMTVAMGVWGHSGQVCIAGTRVLVQREIHDQLVEKVVEYTKTLKIGSGFEADASIGPLISEAQLNRVCRYVKLGKEEGARLVYGGSRHGDKGYFHEPTIFTGVRNDMTIAQEEIFGPVMAVIPFDSEEEAFAIANDSEYGLAAGVWTRDVSRAHRATQKLKAGTVWVNAYLLCDPSVSFGGVKQSGHGRNLGKPSIDELTQTKSVWIKIDS